MMMLKNSFKDFRWDDKLPILFSGAKCLFCSSRRSSLCGYQEKEETAGAYVDLAMQSLKLVKI